MQVNKVSAGRFLSIYITLRGVYHRNFKGKVIRVGEVLNEEKTIHLVYTARETLRSF